MNQALPASEFCAAHQDESARLFGAAAAPASQTRWGGIFARMQGPLKDSVPDGGRFDVPGWLNDAPTHKVMTHLCTHPDSMARWMAAYVLRKRRAVQAIDSLWDALRHDNTRFVRQQAAVALGKIGTPRVFAPLVEGLNHDRDQGVRQACAIALGNFRNPALLDELARVLEREDNIFVKWDCVVALGQLGDGRVEKLLVRMQAEEIAHVVREACRDALTEIRQRARAAA